MKSTCWRCGRTDDAPDLRHESYLCVACDENWNSKVRVQPHYTQFKIQPVVFIAANNLDYFQGNIIKYILRYKNKNGLNDLQKARHYLDMLIQYVEKGEVTP